MTKKDIIDKLAEGAGIKKNQAEKVLEAFVNSLKGSLKAGQRVSVSGFGTFSVVARKARTGRNPRTGKEIKIKERRVPKFSPAASFKELLG
jgi:DNA-binding protein HU-beta